MRTSTIVMTAFAVLFGLLAVFLAQTRLNNQAEQRMKSLEAQQKPVTLEVDATNGQKLAVASSVGGARSLMLRRAGEVAEGTPRRVILSDLGRTAPSRDARIVTIGVTRALKRQDYNVPVEGTNAVSAALSERPTAHD